MIRQRVLGLALGYEDLNDHDQLRTDPLLAAACGNPDLLGEERRHDGPGQGARRQEHPQPPRTRSRQQRRPIPQDQRRLASHRHPSVASGRPCHPAQITGHRARLRRHRRSHPRRPGRPLLPRLLPRILLPSALLLLWRHPAVGRAAQVRPRRLSAAPSKPFNKSSPPSANDSEMK